MELAEGLAGELKEGLVVGAEGVGGEGRELGFQAGVCVREGGDFFGRRGAFRGEFIFDFRFLIFDFRQADAGGGEVRLHKAGAFGGGGGPGLGDEPAQGGTNGQADEDEEDFHGTGRVKPAGRGESSQHRGRC